MLLVPLLTALGRVLVPCVPVAFTALPLLPRGAARAVLRVAMGLALALWLLWPVLFVVLVCTPVPWRLWRKLPAKAVWVALIRLAQALPFALCVERVNILRLLPPPALAIHVWLVVMPLSLVLLRVPPVQLVRTLQA